MICMLFPSMKQKINPTSDHTKSISEKCLLSTYDSFPAAADWLRFPINNNEKKYRDEESFTFSIGYHPQLGHARRKQLGKDPLHLDSLGSQQQLLEATYANPEKCSEIVGDFYDGKLLCCVLGPFSVLELHAKLNWVTAYHCHKGKPSEIA